MRKKMVYLVYFILLFGFVNNASAIQWTGLGDDNLWSNPANWEGNKVPTAADKAMIEVPGAAAPNGPLIQEGIDAEINLLACELAGEPTMTMTGGTLTITGWGIWWGDGPDCNATWYISGGTVELTGSPGIFEMGWGGASSTVIMTGGTVYAKGLKLTTPSAVKAELFLHGGTFNIGTARGGLRMDEGNGLMDITEGTLILEGDETAKINDLIAAGKITAYGGAGKFELDYDGRNPGKTTLTAVEMGKAYNPNPLDGARYPETSATLTWSPADGAASHNVYFGDNFDSVRAGTGGTFRGNQAVTFFTVGLPGSPYPDGLVPGTTYYWRIEEVGADGTTIHKGDVWSFMVPPRTAYNPNPADGAESVDLNVECSWTPGFGAILHTVYFGDNFDEVSNAAGGPLQSHTTYTPGTLELEKVYYWRVDEFDFIATYKGDVWSFSTPGAVGSPNPSNGATAVRMTPTLSWKPGDSAALHQVYLGTDKDAVRNATTDSPEYKASRPLGSESYDPGKLAWYTTYYWRIDEVNDLHPKSPWKGPVWSFTTADFTVVDDFEDYNDYEPDRIFDTWADYSVNNTGATIGNLDPPFAEQSIVHGGSQSMPYTYDNDGTVNEGTAYEKAGTKYYSEAEREWASPQDWTEEGVGVLSLWFRGSSTNAAEPMYVALNDSAVVYHDNPDAAQTYIWTEWTIELQAFADQGVDLTNVNKIAIGFGDKNNPQVGGSGKVYFDDIRLYRPPAVPYEYVYEGDAAVAGPADSFDSLDGSWDHNNGSDQWDGTGPGEGRPGGAAALTEDAITFLRIQDTGDPRDYGMSDPGSNRKVYLVRPIDIGLDGARLEFRARVATTPPLDDAHPNGGAGIEPWPAGGIGYHIRDNGKGMFGISDGVGIISFSLAKAGEPGFEDLTTDVLVMNNLVGNTPSGDVDTADIAAAVARNTVAVADVTQWNTFTIDIAAGGAGTHIVSVSVNGGPAESFEVTTGTGLEHNAPYITIGSSGTGGITAFDVDYIMVSNVP